MHKRTPRKILTVVTSLAFTGVASANPSQITPPKHWSRRGAVTAVLISGDPYLVAPNAVPVPLSHAEYGRFLGETQPLVGPDGRPGCGNIVAKSTGSCRREREAAVARRLDAEPPGARTAVTHDEGAEIVAALRAARAGKANR